MKIDFCDSLKLHPEFSEIKENIEKFYLSETSKESAVLTYEDEKLKLKSDLFSTVYCDFTEKSFIREVRQSYGRSEGVYSFLKPMAKSGSLKICDMTVGMGKDFFKFLLAGHSVIGFERNPVFYYMVKDGLKRFLSSASSEDLKKQFKVSSFSAELRLGETVFDNENEFDLIYYDPMFEEKSKKAAPKKGMQALKHLNKSSETDEKMNCLKTALTSKPRTLIFKCAGITKDFPFVVKKEHKGKGFSYVYL